MKNISLPKTPSQYEMLIDGKWKQSKSGQKFSRVSPAHDVVVGEYPLCDETDANSAIQSARAAFKKKEWRNMAGIDRAKLLQRVAKLIQKMNKNTFIYKNAHIHIHIHIQIHIYIHIYTHINTT